MKALKVTVSGAYKTANGDIIDFEDISGVIPFVGTEHAKMHVRSRYASEWVRNAKKADGEPMFTSRIDIMRQVFIDDIEEVEYDFSYVGKDIKKMSYEELQDLATAKDLRTIPLPKYVSGVDIREMRTKAYVEYSTEVKGDVISERDPDFDFAKLNPLFVDGEARIETAKKLTNDEIIEQEQKITSGTIKDNLTLEDLQKIAKDKGIKHHPMMGFDKLYSLVYNV